MAINIHTVKSGESIQQIAKKYGVSPIKLAENNGIPHGSDLIPGEELLILIPTRTANVRRGERLSDIAQRFNTSKEYLIAINPELTGGEELYEGQPIAIKYGAPLFGMGIANGYAYRGTTKMDIIRSLPYVSYLTVCAAVGRRGSVGLTFDDCDAIGLAKAAGKLPVLRIWLDGEDGASEAVSGAAMMAASKGYHGMCIGGLGVCREKDKIAEKARNILHGCGLKLFLDVDLDSCSSLYPDSDFSILYRDALDNENGEGYNESVKAALKKYSDLYGAYRSFVDLSPFARVNDKYVTKAAARSAILQGRGKIEDIGNGLLCGTAGHGKKKRSFIYESLKCTKQRLEQISSLGYYGISFDVARTPIAELMMFRAMFSEPIGML